MSWRDVLGLANTMDSLYAHNTQYPHNHSETVNFADIAYCALRGTKLLEAITAAIIYSEEIFNSIAPNEHIGRKKYG